MRTATSASFPLIPAKDPCMTPLDATRWCPHCGRATTCAPLPQLDQDPQCLAPTASGEPQGLVRRHYCLACRNIWQSMELPRAFIEQLLEQRRAAEEEGERLRREIAVLRFALANQGAGSEAMLRAA